MQYFSGKNLVSDNFRRLVRSLETNSPNQRSTGQGEVSMCNVIQRGRLTGLQHTDLIKLFLA